MIQLKINGNNSYKKPQNPDPGSLFFSAIEYDIQFMNDHIHDGVSGQLLPTVQQAIHAVDWVAAPIGGGLYRQAVTLPAGLTFDTVEFGFRLSNGSPVFLTVEKISSSSYYVYINDNTQALNAVYSS